MSMTMIRVLQVLVGVIKALTILRDVLRTLSSSNHNTALRVTSRMWIAKFDVEEGNRALAEKYDRCLF